MERAELDLDDWGLATGDFPARWREFTRYYDSDYAQLPDGGGLDDQDAAKMDDLDTLAALVSFHMARLKPEADAHWRGRTGGSSPGTGDAGEGAERFDVWE